MSIYNYSISTDFQSGINESQLHSEIVESAIVTELVGITTEADNCDITFGGTLSEGDETILNGLVSAHIPKPCFNCPTAIIVQSPDGTQWKITVDDDGVLDTTEVQ